MTHCSGLLEHVARCLSERRWLRGAQKIRTDLARIWEAAEALWHGFSKIPALEVPILLCAKKPMQSPGKLAENIGFHSLSVPIIGWLRTGHQECIVWCGASARQFWTTAGLRHFGTLKVRVITAMGMDFGSRPKWWQGQ
jgi:hypothetical protein